MSELPLHCSVILELFRQRGLDAQVSGALIIGLLKKCNMLVRFVL